MQKARRINSLPHSQPCPSAGEGGVLGSLELTSGTLEQHSWSRTALMTAAECTCIVLTSI